jgi:hypothetical protein
VGGWVGGWVGGGGVVCSELDVCFEISMRVSTREVQCVDNGNAHLKTVEHIQSDRQECVLILTTQCVRVVVVVWWTIGV